MFTTQLIQNPETGRYYGEVLFGKHQVFVCPNEYVQKHDAKVETERQFAGTLRAIIAKATRSGGR